VVPTLLLGFGLVRSHERTRELLAELIGDETDNPSSDIATKKPARESEWMGETVNPLQSAAANADRHAQEKMDEVADTDTV
jgi:hypothetical protein